MRRFTFIVLYFFVLTVASAQSGRFFSVDKELSSSLINYVYQDHRDIVWVATVDGLNRYDGAKFTHYKRRVGDSTSLLHNYVRVLFEDSRQRLFVGYFNGLQYYDYATDSFHNIPLLLGDGKPYGAHVLSMIERSNGDVLIATSGHGIFILKDDGSSLKAQQAEKLSPSFMVSHLYEDSQQKLWIASQDRGLFSLDKNGEFKNYLPSFEKGNIFSVCEDREKNLYTGSVTTGLYAYDRDRDEFRPIPSDRPLFVNKLLLNKQGEILVGTEGDGLKIFNPVTKTISEGNLSINTLDFSRSKIHSILEDSKGNIWLGIHQKGVVLLPSKSNNFRYYGYKSISGNIIGSHMVTAVRTDRNGIRWIGTDGDGIYGLLPNGKPPLHFSKKSHPSMPATIMSIEEDKTGNLWLGTYDRGLAKLNPKTGQCEYFNHLLEQTPRIFSLAVDDENTLWIGSMGSGLYSMHIPTGKVTHYRAPQGINYRENADALNSDWVCALSIADGKLFIGTVDGVGCLDLSKRSFTSAFGSNRILPGIIVNAFSEGDKNNVVWVATSEGLTSLKLSTLETKTYTMKDGLPSSVICAVRTDAQQNLWISTNYGISRLNPETKTFVNYYADDGLQGNEFARGAGEMDKDGYITFGGVNGITIFDPNEISNEVRNLDLHITGFYVHNKPVIKGSMSEGYQIIDTSVMDAETFNISQKDNSITIEFSCMEFLNPERIRYMYRLSDQDEWIVLPVGTNNVSFSNLSPGTYVFKVKAKDYNAQSEEKVVSVVIHPVWYFSNTAKIGYALIFLIIVGVFVYQDRQRQRTKRKMLEHMHAKQLDEAKLQFFINIAHEIRTPMSLIISPLKRLMIKDKDKERQRSYATMSQNSERIVRLINQLLDIQRIDKGQLTLRFQETEMVSYIRQLCLAFKEEVHLRKINLRFTHDKRQQNAFIDPDNFDKVLLNILSNALKFTPDNGDVNIHLGATHGEQEKLQLIISDSGIGIPESELEKVFECFYQSREGKHVHSEGTGIGLHLTRSIVELHHGSIHAENNVNAPGCRFVITLPVGREHLQPEEIVSPDHDHHETIIPVSEVPVAASTEKLKSKSRHRVLVVDDDRRMREYLCLEMGNDYHMEKCADGKEALAYILKHTPDLVISDIVLPEMDGLTLCRKVKQNVNINHIPVVLLTGRKEEQYTLEGLEIGADAYIVKPFNIEVVKKTVQNIIRTRELLRNNYSGKQHQEDKIRDVVMKSPDEKLLGKIMDTINNNITNPALNVEMLAHEIGISRVHLHRKLKELTNQSTRDLIRNVRLQQAAKLLAEKHFNVSEVAFSVGFTNVAHFSNSFKEFYGVPPTEYKEAQKMR